MGKTHTYTLFVCRSVYLNTVVWSFHAFVWYDWMPVMPDISSRQKQRRSLRDRIKEINSSTLPYTFWIQYSGGAMIAAVMCLFILYHIAACLQSTIELGLRICRIQKSAVRV